MDLNALAAADRFAQTAADLEEHLRLTDDAGHAHIYRIQIAQNRAYEAQYRAQAVGA